MRRWLLAGLAAVSALLTATALPATADAATSTSTSTIENEIELSLTSAEAQVLTNQPGMAAIVAAAVEEALRRDRRIHTNPSTPQ